MRVIAGKYGGRRLVSFQAGHIRPTTDRVKESLFNKLQGRIEGARILDLFSGTGNLAIEALSRGAHSVVAVEKSKKSISLIEKNKKQLGIGPELRVIPQDVISFLNRGQGLGAQAYDLILIDPPFTEKMAQDVMRALAVSQVFHRDSEVFIESSAQETLGDQYSPFLRQAHKAYGDKYLSHFTILG